MKLDHPSESPAVLLALCVNSLNYTFGPDGLVPSALVFGEPPSLQLLDRPPDPRASPLDRAQIATDVPKEIEKAIAQARIQRALRYRVPTAAESSYQPEE